MRNFILVVMMLVLILPAAVFAEEPTERELEETTTMVLSTLGLVFMSSMFGKTPENVEVQMEDITSGSTIIFDNFDVKAFYTDFAKDEDSAMTEDLPPLSFNRMSGKFSVTAAGDMSVDVKLKGGNIRTLVFRTSGEELAELTANGKDYSYLKDILDQE